MGSSRLGLGPMGDRGWSSPGARLALVYSGGLVMVCSGASWQLVRIA